MNKKKKSYFRNHKNTTYLSACNQKILTGNTIHCLPWLHTQSEMIIENYREWETLRLNVLWRDI